MKQNRGAAFDKLVCQRAETDVLTSDVRTTPNTEAGGQHINNHMAKKITTRPQHINAATAGWWWCRCSQKGTHTYLARCQRARITSTGDPTKIRQSTVREGSSSQLLHYWDLIFISLFASETGGSRESQNTKKCSSHDTSPYRSPRPLSPPPAHNVTDPTNRPPTPPPSHTRALERARPRPTHLKTTATRAVLPSKAEAPGRARSDDAPPALMNRPARP